jgi:hypothetical protein
MSLPEQIETEQDVRQLVVHLIREENLNFHPDTPFSDYINLTSGEPTYTLEECAVREKLTEDSFLLVGERIYNIGLKVLLTLMR